MRIYLTIGAVCVALLFMQCQKEGTTELEAIKGQWVHAYEEDDEGGHAIYRPSEYRDFPASRFRQVFHFKDDNVCTFLVLAPDDGHYYQDGHWQYDDDTAIVRVSDKSYVIYEFRVVELTDKLLKIEML